MRRPFFLLPLSLLCVVATTTAVLAQPVGPAAPPPPGPETQTTTVEGPGVPAAVPVPAERPQLTLHPAIGGPIGLFNNYTAEVGPAWTFRFSLTAEIFRSSDFLVVGDTNT